MIQIGYKVSLTAVLLAVLLGINFQLEGGENPYLAINTRNAFNLGNEPPSRKSAPPPAPEKSEDIKLTGIYKHKGVQRVALAMIDPKKKTEPPKYIELAAGEKQGGIEIVSIDKKTGKVTVKEFGSLKSLTFKEDAFKTSVSKSPRSSSKSSSSRTSDAAKKAADARRESYERKKREEAEKKKREESSRRSSSYSNLSSEQRDQMRSTYEQLTRGKSDAEKVKIREQFAAEFRGGSSGSSGSSGSTKGRDSSRSRSRGR